MTEETGSFRPAGERQGWGQQHSAIVKAEIGAINTRREENRKVEYESPEKVLDVVGLTLSGGGMRSAALSLGVLQALNYHDLLKRIDYLSTVSGGGYIGSSLTATMIRAGEFVFGKRAAGAGPVGVSQIGDTPAVGHIRNYSNYLIPAGARDLLTGMAVVVRGLVANLSLILPLVLFLAAATIFSNPARSCLHLANFFGFRVGDAGPLPFLGDSFLGQLDFMVVGVFAALAILVVGFLLRWLNDDRLVFFAYLAGTAFVMGAICNIGRYLPVEHFGLTLAAALVGIMLFFIWALWRSLLPPDRLQEFRSHLPTMGATYLVLLGVIAFFEFQTTLIASLFEASEGSSGKLGILSFVNDGITSLSVIAAPIAGVVTLFRQQFIEALKGDSDSASFASQALAAGAKAAIWLANATVPLLMWVAYLYLSYWGIPNDKVLPANDRQCQVAQWDVNAVLPTAGKKSDSLAGKLEFNSEKKTLAADVTRNEAKPLETEPVTVMSHIPGWLLSFATPFGGPRAIPSPPPGETVEFTKAFKQSLAAETNHAWVTSKAQFQNANNVNRAMALLYLATAIGLFALSWFLTPNANSLHRLYRDRLSKAFLFNPRYYADVVPTHDQPSIDQGHDFLPLDKERLSTLLRPGFPPTKDEKLVSPYPLINTTLNIQGSDFATRRGRNADFFLFSPLFVGSEATGYAKTADFEKVAPDLDLATAMAISGAAASSNMESASQVLAPTLALLNVRLGYWLKNPRYVGGASSKPSKPLRQSTPLFLWSEIAGRLYENSESVYLTHGGQIENLGIYELLRRRCKVIIAVDAEADAPMNFSALMTLQRYAHIDLGILIDVPWPPIQEQTLAWMSNSRKPATPPPLRSQGAHVAIGTIDYGGSEMGYLVYIKSSLTGDENDYIRDYARRNNSFPHETTGDQFFSGEQFEVYRALGFHITHGFLAGTDDVVVNEGQERYVKTPFTDGAKSSIKNVREALGLDPPPTPPAAAHDNA